MNRLEELEKEYSQGVALSLQGLLKQYSTHNTYYEQLISSSDTHDDILITAMIFLYYAEQNLKDDVEINKMIEYKNNLQDLQDIINRLGDNFLQHAFCSSGKDDYDKIVYSYKDYKRDLEKEIGK